MGGARPKASVLATDGSLWIAKFPSKNDDFNSGAWEMVVHELAVMCGLNVPEAKAEKFSRLGTTFLVKRFDRIESRRIHFSSAMTMLGKKDGANAADGSSYLEIVSFLKANGATPKKIYRNCGSVLCLAWQCPIQTIILEIMDLFWRRKGGYFLRCMM